MKLVAILVAAFLGTSAQAATKSNDFLVKLTPEAERSGETLQPFAKRGAKVEKIGLGWVRVQLPAGQTQDLGALMGQRGIVGAQKNGVVRIPQNPKLQDPAVQAQIRELVARGEISNQRMGPDNPPLPMPMKPQVGMDPLIYQQWGMKDIGMEEVWKASSEPKNGKMVVAVIDTGVDYLHEDLAPNLWRNPGELGIDENGNDKSSNGVDDDNNGYVDDIVGWDFASNDNLPYDLAGNMLEILQGANPGHGTHCAGNVAARGGNATGISGVAPKAKIMILRFITEKGQGTTADAVKSILYAVNNGAKVLSNSWGSEGDEPQDPDTEALRDAIKYAQAKDVLFIAAAGNGHQGQGYDNDSDPKPGVPASYPMENIVSVAALDSQDQLGAFSNWGLKTVDLGAPGCKVFSTTVGGKYSDMVIDFWKLQIAWDGTSMATPHVAGAAALYWSMNPSKKVLDVKNALLKSTVAIPAMSGKSVSGGKLNVSSLMKQP